MSAAPVVTIHPTEPLYVIRSGDCVSCLGFDVAEARRVAVLRFLGYVFRPELVTPGTVEAYNAYRCAMELGQAHYDRTGERCPADLTPELIGLEGARVEVVDSYGETRRFQVGKSTGWFPCHLELARAEVRGGHPVTGAPFRSLRVVRLNGART